MAMVQVDPNKPLMLGDVMPDCVLAGIDADNQIVAHNPMAELNWKVLYFYPKDFTFVCPTEIVDFDNLVDDFKELNATVYGISPDNEYCKLAWKQENKLLKKLKHTLLADSGNTLASACGIVSRENVPYRVTYILNENNVIQYIGMHQLSVGRNAAEVLRVLDGCQKGEEGLLCPAAREVGGETL